MADTTTTVYALSKPDKGKQDWDVPLNTNFDIIDQGLACARTHYRIKTLTFAEAMNIQFESAYAEYYLAATGNITSMALDWSKMFKATKPGNAVTVQLRIVPSANISIAWPSNVIWMNGAVPRLNGTKIMRIQFVFASDHQNVKGSFMGWEG